MPVQVTYSRVLGNSCIGQATIRPMPILLEALKASGGVVNRGGLPLHFGDPEAEETAIREGAGLTPTTWRVVVEVTGRDRAKFLHNVTTNDVLKLATGREGNSFGKDEKFDLAVTPAGRGQFTVVPNKLGKMVADGKLRLFEDRAWLEIDKGALTMTSATLGGVIVSEDVQVKERSKEIDVFRIDGPQSRDVLSKALGTVPDLAESHFAKLGEVVV